MTLFQEASQLNNEGIRSLLIGDQAAAIELMKEALCLMKAQLSTALNPSSQGNDANARLQDTCTVEIPQTLSSDVFLFNQAVRIPNDADPTSAFDLNICISVVIFNLALACHHKAPEDAVSLTKAENLYCMVLKLLDDSTLDMHAALLVKLACINNLSQIRCYNGDQVSIQDSLGQISYIMSQSPDHTILEEPRIQALLINALLLQVPEVASAA